MSELSLEEKLMNHIQNIELNPIVDILAQDVNVNYERENSTPYDQPTTPLKLCVFRLSDCMLVDEDLLKLVEIMRLLVLAGANYQLAKDYYELRYGIPDEQVPSIFLNAYRLLSPSSQ